MQKMYSIKSVLMANYSPAQSSRCCTNCEELQQLEFYIFRAFQSAFRKNPCRNLIRKCLSITSMNTRKSVNGKSTLPDLELELNNRHSLIYIHFLLFQ